MVLINPDLTTAEGPFERTLDVLKVRQMPHALGRSLYDHLSGTRDILAAWSQSEALMTAGLFHSVYSTDSYKPQAVPFERRGALATVLGSEAESLVYFFSITKREELMKLLRSAANEPSGTRPYFEVSSSRGGHEFISRDVLLDLAILHLANLAEQSSMDTGEPGVYLSYMSDVARQLISAGYIGKTIGEFGKPFDLTDEMQARLLYREAIDLECTARSSGLSHFVRCSDLLPFLAEPLLWQAWIEVSRGNHTLSRELATKAICNINRFGTCWDKRLSATTWLSIAIDFESSSTNPTVELALESILRSVAPTIIATEDTSRFVQYLTDDYSEKHSKRHDWYPGLKSQPWHSPHEFQVVRALEEAFPQIRDEAVAVGTHGYHDEAEPIHRSGSWKIFTLFEGGRKNDANCLQCPTLTALIEQHDEVRKTSGLVYLSRLTSGSRIAAHRGGSNIRLRCHLGIIVPSGDCQMRVGLHTKPWTTGKCLVFDDFYEHEVWNNTEEDRLVLVVDLWHPDLLHSERTCLEALNWSVNRRSASNKRYLEMNRKQIEREKGEILVDG